MGWIKVSEGSGFDSLRNTVGNMELPVGTKIQAVCEVINPTMFDGFYAESMFRAQVPEGCQLIDVYGEGPVWPWAKGRAVMEMEVVGITGAMSGEVLEGGGKISGKIGFGPIWLVPLILGLAKWSLIALAVGMTVAMLVSFVRIMAKITHTVEAAAPWLVWTLIIGGIAVAGYFGYKYISSRDIRAGPVTVTKALPEGRG